MVRLRLQTVPPRCPHVTTGAPVNDCLRFIDCFKEASASGRQTSSSHARGVDTDLGLGP